MTAPGQGGHSRPPGSTPGEARRRVVVVGAGIAGLTCAWRLTRLLRDNTRSVDLIVLEGSARAGGVIQTERADGFLVEGGPDCFISEKPWGVDLCRELGLEGELIGTNPALRRSFVLHRDRLLPIPEGYQLIAPSRFLPFAASPILSLRGKLRILFDLLLPRGSEVADESLASFVRRRFGEEALERLAQPLLAGIYNADPERLSLRATFPRFLEMERSGRSVILSLLRSRRRPGSGSGGVSGARYSLFVTLRSGLQTLVDRLLAGLQAGTVRLRTRVASVARRREEPGAGPAGRYEILTDAGERIPADAVVLALPAPEAAPLARALDPGLADGLGAIPYGTSATVSLAFRRGDVPRLPEGFGFVVPRAERRSLLACTFSSLKFADRAPRETLLLRAFFGGSLAGEADEEQIEREAREQLLDILDVQARPLHARTFVHPRAMAQYEVGHLDRVAAIERRLAGLPGLALAGNGLRGVGVPDCIHSGEEAARRVAAEVTG
jgi:protoporphyrinogen/coproporphyrinogen III oxidase